MGGVGRRRWGPSSVTLQQPDGGPGPSLSGPLRLCLPCHGLQTAGRLLGSSLSPASAVPSRRSLVHPLGAECPAVPGTIRGWRLKVNRVNASPHSAHIQQVFTFSKTAACVGPRPFPLINRLGHSEIWVTCSHSRAGCGPEVKGADPRNRCRSALTGGNWTVTWM